METINGSSFHINLANYFTKKPLYLDEPTQKKPNTRKLVEQPWQLLQGLKYVEFVNTLLDFNFLQAKVNAGLTRELIYDYDLISIPRKDRPDITQKFDLIDRRVLNLVKETLKLSF